MTFWELECSSCRPTIERITATLSITPAIRGRCSPIWTPGSRVGDRLELAADAVGRVGLEVEGILMRRAARQVDHDHRLVRRAGGSDRGSARAPASAWSSPGRLSPPIASPPILRNDRRDRPSQYRSSPARSPQGQHDRSLPAPRPDRLRSPEIPGPRPDVRRVLNNNIIRAGVGQGP